jgi:hypothetical protein
LTLGAAQVIIAASLARFHGSMDISAQQVLDTPLPANSAGAADIRAYLVLLLLKVWREVEGFDGKRPFGDSAWYRDLYAGLVRAGLIDGRLGPDGHLEEADDEAGDRLIELAIAAL